MSKVDPFQAMLASLPVFSELNEHELRQLANIAHTYTIPRKSNLFNQNDPRTSTFFILSGIVKLYKVDAVGNEHTLNFIKAGEMFPHTGFFDDSPYDVSAETVEETIISVIPIQAFEQLLIENPVISVKVMRMMGRLVRELQTKLQEFGSGDVNLRVASVLQQLSSKHGVDQPEGLLINLPLTNQDVASMASTSRETVNRFLNQLKKLDIIAMRKHKITILNMVALSAYLNNLN
ncbi:Crp/Fnr family transcriptional regulator [Paenibacillus sp. N1-5-1-14]|uniref:Crp/Fnr family transcriptional regulator n=1 Tax=Paenibacillus radicibacter TaxID=2972488 RepID=UPI0021593CA2|nr:Crp/Fnr family transcriptional regulator [Paenibacillus radicibacter]MCR8643209.1 Crp/Fnr family transcriptional regulator [Paenibacillus radicibacter]